MFKVAILGCENSHADSFLKLIFQDKIVDDVEIVGVFSEYEGAAEKLGEEFGVPVAEAYDEFVGKVDGIIITARHGDKHYQYAKPYLDCGIPMFIDKPITCSEEDAIAFRKELESRKVPVCGGSMCIFMDQVQKMKKVVETGEYGKVYGGYLRAPYNSDNPYGGFYFYTQHLAQMTMEVFGYYPKSVWMEKKDDALHCVVKYEDYDVNLCYVDHNRYYYVGVSCADAFVGDVCNSAGCAKKEFMEFYELLQGEEQKQSYSDFFAPVYVINAMYRALNSGCEEDVHKFEGNM